MVLLRQQQYGGLLSGAGEPAEFCTHKPYAPDVYSFLLWLILPFQLVGSACVWTAVQACCEMWDRKHMLCIAS